MSFDPMNPPNPITDPLGFAFWMMWTLILWIIGNGNEI